jgi:hypothetical protein
MNALQHRKTNVLPLAAALSWPGVMLAGHIAANESAWRLLLERALEVEVILGTNTGSIPQRDLAVG